MIRGGCLALTFFTLLLGVTAAQAENRVALVIGNGAYQSVPVLANPVNDAGDIAASLKRLDFEVKILSNAKYDEMRRALVSFGQQARGADFAVVFFAGHGMEIGGENWLIPVDAQLAADADVPGEAIGLQFLMRSVSNAGKLGLVILDACRNNPFLQRMQRTNMTRATERGFVRVEPGDNILVAYSARDGTTASDGGGRNSPFTQALLKNLETPGLEVRFLFANVRDDVIAATNRGQQPFTYGSLSKDPIYFRRQAATPAEPSKAQPADPAAQAWAAAQNTSSAEVLEEFIRVFGDSFYASLARARLAELKKQQQAALVVPPPAAQSKDCAGSATAVSLSVRAPCPLSQAEERSLKAKDVFRECDNCPEMVVVPAGRFAMGASKNEPRPVKKAGPQHDVTIPGPFAVGKFDITVDQFKAFVDGTGYGARSSCLTYENGKLDLQENRSWRNPGFMQAGSHPAVCLNWKDAKAYVGWLAKKTGKSYRLLSEAEWEYAARAGTTTRHYFGDDEKDMCRYGNVGDQWAKRTIGNRYWKALPCHDGYVHTSPVGAFLPNGFGLYDMTGNVQQWVEDCWSSSYVGAPSDGSAWTTANCGYRVTRGGSWYGDSLDNHGSAVRDESGDTVATSYTGFRIARTLAP